MNKVLKAMGCALIGGSLLCATAFSACGKSGLDPEKRALNLAIGALDDNFNPFFYTSANDGEVIAMTQVSLLSVDPDGNPAVGENYPVVAKDYTYTYYNEVTGGSATENSEDAKRTEYEFLIKNGMKFSDGTPLTIQDVLFNFYVYLDPSYTGSNIMYSVDIQGLAAYQKNDSTLGVDAEVDTSDYAAKAQARINALIEWSNDRANITPPDEDDIQLVASLFEEELNSDWTAIETSWQETYKVNYNFKAAWQAYLYQEGIVSVQERKNSDGTTYQIRVDASGNEVLPTSKEYDTAKNLTTLDGWADGAIGASSTGVVECQNIIDEVTALTNGITDEYEYLQKTKEYCIKKVYDTNLVSDKNSGLYGYGYANVLQWWATAANAYSAFLADERGKAIENADNPRYYISGIQTYKTSTFKGAPLNSEYDVLKIVINGVDPAAIWNFGISIAPLNYYSGSYNGVNYVEKATAWSKTNGYADGEGQYGVKRGDFDFLEKVVKSKSKLPKGAGAYAASTSSGNVANDGNDFKSNNIVYYQRNEYFETMGANIHNAKIKYLKYKVLEDDRIIPALNGGDIDYGQPNATPTNFGLVQGNKSYRSVPYDTNGYGYVGINPTYVPDVNIRIALMRAMNIGDATSYYGSLAKPIYRPMSTTSWAYPNLGEKPVYHGLEPLSSGTEIKNFLLENNYYQQGNSWYDASGNKVETNYTFTIAGANSDHPAYRMFVNAAGILKQAGFNITVSTRATALRDLTQGTLAIWAAAYSTGIDPDMYQVYHKDSQATSILNWGYRTILNNQSKYPYEYDIINELSDKIEDARKTLNQTTRKAIYADCLDLIMDLAIQLPIYQRQDLCVFNKKVINEKTVNLKADEKNGVLNRIWEVEYVK